MTFHGYVNVYKEGNLPTQLIGSRCPSQPSRRLELFAEPFCIELATVTSVVVPPTRIEGGGGTFNEWVRTVRTNHGRNAQVNCEKYGFHHKKNL